MASPPKPWERAAPPPMASERVVRSSSSNMSSSPTATATATATAHQPNTTPNSSTTSPPQLPERPPSLSVAAIQSAPNASYTTSAFSSPYASPYSRLGTYNRLGTYSSMGAIGGYGNMYGGYGYNGYGGYSGYGGMYGGSMYGAARPPGMLPDPNNPDSLTNQFNQGTQATFQLLEGMVGAFTGFAQMLESTYMTTHSSFFAMVAVAEQIGNLRNTLGHVLGIFTLLRWLRTLFAKLTGRPPPADATALNPLAFAQFQGRSLGAHGNANGDAAAGTPRPSRKPLLFFLAAAFGIPYLLKKLISSLVASQERRTASHMLDAAANVESVVDPAQLEFCRVMWDYPPADQPQPAVNGLDLAVKKGELLAVLSKADPAGKPSSWWRCRSRAGLVGYVPSAYLQIVLRPTPRPAPAAIPAVPSPSGYAPSAGSAYSASTYNRLLNSDQTLLQESNKPVSAVIL